MAMPACRNGRRGGLKIHWWQHRAGSSPAALHLNRKSLKRLLRFFVSITIFRIWKERFGTNRQNSLLTLFSALTSMMKQPDPCKCHHNSIFIACFNHMIITDRTAWLGNKIDSAFMSTFNIITKWEKCIRAKRYSLHAL